MKKIPAILLSVITTLFSLAQAASPGWQTFSAELVEQPRIQASASLSRGAASGAQTYTRDTVILDAPVVQLRLPLGQQAEAILGYPIWRSLRSDQINTGNGGDPWFFTKLRLSEGKSRWPALAFIWGVLEPAANPPIGPDNLAFYAHLAASQRLGEHRVWRLDLNLGTAIHESDERTRQDDVLKLNTALWYTGNTEWQAGLELTWADETAGRWFDFTQTRNGPYRRRSLALSLEGRNERALFIRLRRGLVSQSGTWSGTLGVNWRL